MIHAALSLPHRWAACAAVLLAALASSPASAQLITIVSVDAGTPNLGTVASAASGDTVFRVAPDTGQVTRLSGAGAETPARPVPPPSEARPTTWAYEVVICLRRCQSGCPSVNAPQRRATR